MHETGVIHGRFQILHNDHMKYLLAGKARCRHLVVGITNPDPTLSRRDEADPKRSRPESNPLTYFERYRMIKESLLDEGLAIDEFSIVPFPVNFPELYKYYVPMDGVFFMTIYDRWGEKKKEMFESLGLVVEILWKRPLDEKGLTSTEIRRHILENEPWEQFVPPAVGRLIDSFGIPERLKKLRG